MLITNKHVIEATSQCRFVVHAANNADAKKPDSIRPVNSQTSEWISHPNPKIDLCALPIAGLLENKNPQPFLRFLDPAMIPTTQQLEDLNAVEDILMVGYPNGLWDAVNNYPLIRRGITASHPGVDFDVDGVGTTVVDIAAFPGSSGSPIFVYNNGTITDKKGNVSIATRLIFLGVLFSGPVMRTDGKIVIRNIPTADVPVAELSLTLNLGYIIKARDLQGLVNVVLQKFGLTQQ